MSKNHVSSFPNLARGHKVIASVCIIVKCSRAGAGGRGLKLADGLRKSTECLASLSPDSSLAPGSLDRATSQPNLLAIDSADLVSSSPSNKRRGKSPSKHRAAKTADDSVQASKDVIMITVSGPAARSGSDPGGISASTRRAAGSRGSGSLADGPAEDGSCERSGNEEDAATDKLAVIDHTLAKVMSSLKTLDEIEQNTGAAENVDGVKNAAGEDGQKPAAAVLETVPIIVRKPSTREDRPDESSSLGSFSRGGAMKAATLPKSGSVEKIPADADFQIRRSDSSHFETSLEDRQQLPGSRLSRSDSAPQRKGDSGSAAVQSSNVGQSRFEASSRAIPAATPVVPSNASSGAPAVPPKPAKKPPVFGSPKTSRPSTDGKAGVVSGKLTKK